VRDGDPIDLIEAAYDLDAGPQAWLDRLAELANERMGEGLGLMAFRYEVSPEHRMRIGEMRGLGMPDGVPDMMRGSLEGLPPGYVERTFVRCECTTQSEVTDPEVVERNRPAREAMAAFGWRDIAMVGGMDPCGNGIYLGAWLPREKRLPERVRTRWCRVAVHLVTAQRLRRRVPAPAPRRIDAADAVLTPGGRLEHARADAGVEGGRAALRDAVKALESARGSMRRQDPDLAVATWKGLVEAQWSLVDHFESDGKRYVVAYRNDSSDERAAPLSGREREVVSRVAMGHSNKLIAYELGLAASTVRVFVARAAAKLGAASREELIEAARRAADRARRE